MAISKERMQEITSLVTSYNAGSRAMVTFFIGLVTDYWNKHQRGCDEISYTLQTLKEEGCTLLPVFKTLLVRYAPIMIDKKTGLARNRTEAEGWDKGKHTPMFQARLEILNALNLKDLRSHARVLKEYEEAKGIVAPAKTKEELKKEKEKEVSAIERAIKKIGKSGALSQEQLIGLIKAFVPASPE